MADLVSLVDHGEISAPSAKIILAELFTRGGDPLFLMEELDLGIIQDADKIGELVAQIIQEHPDQVQEYLSGKSPIFQWLLGQVMRSAGGRADPSTVQQVLSKHLETLLKD